MSQKRVRQAIEGRLASWAAARVPALRIAFENASFTPASASETYLRAHLLPADTRSQTLDGVHRAWSGIYQVTVHAALNTGPGGAEGIAVELDALFPNNLRITAGGLTTQVVAPVSAGVPEQSADRYLLPVYFTYRADAT